MPRAKRCCPRAGKVEIVCIELNRNGEQYCLRDCSQLFEDAAGAVTGGGSYSIADATGKVIERGTWTAHSSWDLHRAEVLTLASRRSAEYPCDP